jgi:ATP-dependent RNA helicase DHX8/PRP22
MSELADLQYLSLVSKICVELENHIGVSDKVLAEFIIDLADKHPTADAFQHALDENGAEMPSAFVANLLQLIQKMRPKKKGAGARGGGESAGGSGPSAEHPDGSKPRFSGLAIPNTDAQEKARLEKQAAKLQASIDKLAARINAPGFADKAPAKVVEQVHAELREQQEQLETIRKSVADLLPAS